MATYYVRKTGSDSNAGTSAGAAWLTIGKALGATGIASGDTVYVGAGVYRENVTVNMTSATAETKVVADVEGEFTGDAGEVRWTAYTTNDKTSPTTGTLSLNGRDYLTFQRFVMVGGSASCISAATTVSTNIKVQDCTLISGTGATAEDRLILWDNAAGEAANWTVERCVFVGTYGAYIKFDSLTVGSSDYDLAFTIRNCLFVGSAFTDGFTAGPPVIHATSGGGGSGSGKPGGIIVQNCTSLVGGYAFVGIDASTGTTTANGFSTSTPCRAVNNIILAGTYALASATSGQLVEDYNMLVGNTNRLNVTAGSNSKTDNDYSLLLNFGQHVQQKRLPRVFGMPTLDSPFLGFDNAATPTALTTDFWERPKPSGGGPSAGSANKAIGYLEHHDFGIKETTTVDSGSSASIKMTGPGDLEIRVPVDAVSTTITIKDYFDSNYGGGTKPQVILLANGGIGVATQTVTDTGSASTWNTISLAAFTPTAKGWVTLRLNSQSAATGIVYWDTMSVT
jgi:hypothetical protein